jgi:hypothetical protein
MSVITLNEAPKSIANHYDKGSSACRVLKVEVRDGGHLGERYYVTHTWGKDTWAYFSGVSEWRIVKQSN